jgi:L-ascorbate metabolism protein UlaG (beta-lactamase superfamily)
MDDKQSTIEMLQSIGVPKGCFAINWIGQGGFVFKLPQESIICIDPYLSNCVERFEGLGMRRMWFNSFPIHKFNPDIVICTHNHLDHTDPETLPLIAAYSKALFLAPSESYSYMKKMNIDINRLKKFNQGEEYQGQDFKVRAVYAKHTKDSIGIILELENIKIYITGDTEESEKLYDLRDEGIDIVIACINGKLGNLDALQACLLAQKLDAKVIIPMHYGLMPGNTVDIAEFIDICDRKLIDRCILMPEVNYLCSKESNTEKIVIKTL